LNEFSYLDKTTSNAQTLPNEQTVDKIMTLEQKKCAVILNELEDDLFQLLDEQMKSIEQSRKRLKFYLDDIELNMFD
ncbi:MAG: hypothetical protein H8D23_03860, partial [Candidatus Brocadiales bacterium]|nr:hypothetical protein [Candidatus Brocadiales bacterium]